MLDAIRKKKENLLYSLIILAVAAVMAFYGIGKYGDKGGNSGGAAAWVNGEMVSQQEFRQELEYKLSQYQQMLGAQYDEKLLTALQVPQRTLQELIQFKLLAQQAKKLDILVPDSELAEHIRSLPYYQKDGKFDAELYSKLPNRGLAEKEQREHLETAKFQRYLADRVRLTPAEVKRALLLEGTKVDLEYAKIDFNALTPNFVPTAKEVQAATSGTGDADVKQYYESHKADYTDKPQVLLKQIRVGIPYQAADAVRALAKKKVDDIAKDLTKDNFEQVARAKSDDENAKKGGVVGWVNRGTLEKPIEEAIDKLPENQVSAPIDTPFGYFIVLVAGKKGETVHPLDEVKTQIAQKVIVEKNKKKWAEDKRKEWETALAAGKSIEPELKKAKLELKKTGAFSIGQGFIPNLGQVDAMVDAVFELTKEQPFSKKLVYYQENYYFLKLKSIDLPKPEETEKAEEGADRKEVTNLQSDLIRHWVADLEKHASVKTEIAFEDKNHPHEPNEEN